LTIYKFGIKKEMRKMGRLDSKVALVTGASAGMGNDIAKLFAKEGASVVVIARRKERLADLVAQIEADGGKALPWLEMSPGKKMSNLPLKQLCKNSGNWI
jgi:NAD(P)-dependent dehydrogenase (short-subunit alcohol dehydrogenase family)